MSLVDTSKMKSWAGIMSMLCSFLGKHYLYDFVLVGVYLLKSYLKLGLAIWGRGVYHHILGCIICGTNFCYYNMGDREKKCINPKIVTFRTQDFKKSLKHSNDLAPSLRRTPGSRESGSYDDCPRLVSGPN